MVQRTDFSYDLTRTPRVLEVADDGTPVQNQTEVVLEDYVDTTRLFESSFEAMSHPFLFTAGGKEDLGGGTFVGITVSAKDFLLSFEGRTTATHIGTVTTASGPVSNNGVTFIDTSATFETDGVARGSLVINFTDQCVADVLSVVNETTLETKVPVNGTDNDFDIGDAIQVFNIIQCTQLGGNLTAVDDADLATAAILPTAFTQVILQTSSSSTLVGFPEITAQLDTIEAQTTTAQMRTNIWDALVTSYTVTGSFGQFIGKQVLTVIKFFGLNR